MTERALEYRQIQNPPPRRRKRFHTGRVLFVITALTLILLAIFLFVYKLLDGFNVVTPLSPRSGVAGSDLSRVQAEKPDLPVELLDLLEKNPETYDFVMGYSKNREQLPEIDISGDVTAGTIPLFLQWDERWGYDTYGSGMIAITGCGPTCLSMVAVGLTGDTSLNPRAVAEYCTENGYYAWGSGTKWTLMSEGAKQLGLYSRELPLHEPTILSELESETPIICAVGKGDFTTDGHYIVLTGVNDDGTIRVNDPNSIIRSEKDWDIAVIMKQVKNLWAFEAENTKAAPPPGGLKR